METNKEFKLSKKIYEDRDICPKYGCFLEINDVKEFIRLLEKTKKRFYENTHFEYIDGFNAGMLFMKKKAIKLAGSSLIDIKEKVK